jgi:hypothetical protein
MQHFKILSLHYDGGRALVRIVPDERWPNTMFQLVWPSGETSDLVNLSRAKDAAIAICERGPPRRDARLFHWRLNPRESLTEPRPCVRRVQPVEARP